MTHKLYDPNWLPNRNKLRYTCEEALQLMWLSAIRMLWNGLDELELMRCVKAIEGELKRRKRK